MPCRLGLWKAGEWGVVYGLTHSGGLTGSAGTQAGRRAVTAGSGAALGRGTHDAGFLQGRDSAFM